MRWLAFVGLLAAVAPGPRVQTSHQVMFGAVSGLVLDATTHRPIEGVNVQLGPPPSTGQRLTNVLTDERGRFVFVGVPPGAYFINATKSGYEDGHYGPGVNGALGGILLLAEGEWFGSANVQMARLAALGGRIVNERAEPVSGAYVRALTRVVVGGAARLVAGPVVVTDDLGEYRIAGLRSGSYAVMVPSVQQSVPTTMGVSDLAGLTADPSRALAGGSASARTRRATGTLLEGSTQLILGAYTAPPPSDSKSPQVYPIVFYPGVLSVTEAIFVDLKAGDERSDLNFALQPVPTVRVSGRVEDPSGATSGMVLRLVPAGLEDLGDGSESATTAVRSDGAFTFLRVPSGQYTLMAPGSTFEFMLRPAAVSLRYATLPATPGLGGRGASGALVSGVPGIGYNSHVSTTIGNRHAGYARAALTVGIEGIENLVVPLVATAVIHGRIMQTDPAKPLGIATVELAAADGDPTLGAHVCGVTRTARDVFECQVVVPGAYVLRLPNFTIDSIEIDGHDYSRRPIGVASGQDLAVTVRASRGSKLSGVIRDAHGTAVPLAAAIAFPTDRLLWTDYGFVPTWIRPSVGTSNGTYQITSIRTGEYYVVGVNPRDINAWTNPAFLAAVSPIAARVTLNSGDAKVIDPPLVNQK